MSYAKYTFIFLMIIYFALELLAHGWYESILSGATPREFLIPLMLLLWVALQVMSSSTGSRISVLYTIRNGLVAGTVCGLAAWVSILIQRPELLMEITQRAATYGFFGLTLLVLFQLVLGGWLIGMFSFYTIRKSYPLVQSFTGSN